jgi:acetoin utilization protein AcuB
MAQAKKVSDIMTHDVISLLEEQNLATVAATFQRLSFHHLPVVDGKKVVGMVSQRDLLHATVSGLDTSVAAQAREARFLERTFVRDLMQTTVVTCGLYEPIATAAERMLKARVDALPVVNERAELVGIVTAHDLLRVLSEG